MITQENIAITVGAVIAVVLQFVVAPYIGLFGAVPNFLVAYTLAAAIVRSSSFGAFMPFLLGIVFDFAGGGTVGAMAFCLTAFSTLSSRLFARFDNDSLFMAFALMALGVLFVELSYGIFLLAGGYSASIVDALVYRVAPCFLYDFVLAAIMYPILSRFAKPAGTVRAELTQLR